MALCSVKFIKKNAGETEQRLLIKQNGPPRPELQLVQQCTIKTKKFKRIFRVEQYRKAPWLCGCDEQNALFCFPCLIFSDTVNVSEEWSKTGVTDLAHLSAKILKHRSSHVHMKNELLLSDIGSVDVRQLLDSAYRKSIKAFNEEVTQNRHILSRLINCVKFCGVFELALRGPDETADSSNRGIYRGLVDFVAEIDMAMKQHLEGNSIFKGTSRSVQNDILDAILTVCHEEIKRQISEARFVAIQCDETTEVSTSHQLVLILRYERNGQIHERFWKFLNPASHSADDIATEIKKELEFLKIAANQLVAQSYDGGAVMSARVRGVQNIIKNDFPYAFFVHCYAHQFNAILQNSVCVNRSIANFFANLHAFPAFFSGSPKRTAWLDDVKKSITPSAPMTKWNFNTRTVRVVSNNAGLLKRFLRHILDLDENDFNTINQAQALLGYLNDDYFNYWLDFFAKVMPHVEILFKELQSPSTNAFKINEFVKHFQKAIVDIRTSTPLDSQALSYCLSAETKKVCNILINQVKDRFEFTDHLLASKLFSPDKFIEYESAFPNQDFVAVAETYNFLDKAKLKGELFVIYARQDFRQAASALSILQLFIDRNLTECFSESVLLLKLICTIPMTSVDSERCFSTLKRIKSLLRRTMEQERLNSVTMLSTEKEMIANIPDFNNRVIEVFATMKNRRMNFLYK